MLGRVGSVGIGEGVGSNGVLISAGASAGAGAGASAGIGSCPRETALKKIEMKTIAKQRKNNLMKIRRDSNPRAPLSSVRLARRGKGLQNFEMAVFYLVRHGQTDWNVQRRLQGSHDIPINETGREQARALRAFFQTRPLQAWFASPMSRAQETLKIATGVTDLVIEPSLGEVILGPLEGLSQQEVIDKFGTDLWAKWSTISPEGQNFAFEGAESPAASNLRLREGLKRLARDHAFTQAAVCTHGFLLRRFLQELDPVDPPRIIPNGLIAEVVLENGTFELAEVHEVLPPVIR